ncbi:MAG: hypothetical protein U0166_26715 [Acidobacteriota bacterium]
MPSLLEIVQNVIVKLYDLDPRLPGAERFLIGDDGRRRFYGDARIVEVVRSDAFPAQVLVRPSEGEELRVSIYLPDAIIGRLEEHDPTRALHEDNIDAFLCFVEEIDHFLLIASKWSRRRTVTLLELELHANVTKHFVARHFLRRQLGVLPAQAALFLAYHLFHKRDFSDADDAVRARYADARRLGVQYLRYLETLDAARRLRELRAWSDASAQEKVSRILLAA